MTIPYLGILDVSCETQVYEGADSVFQRVKASNKGALLHHEVENCLPETLNNIPETLNNIPETLNNIPETLNNIPETLNNITYII